MKLGQAFKLAIKSILSSKMRSFLTMLGMIIGVGAVISLLGLGNGVKNYMINTFADMGTNLITVSVSNTDSRKVTVDEVYDFTEKYSDVFEGVSPKVSSSYTVKNGSNSDTSTVYGVGEDYLDINNLDLSSGRFISFADIKNRYHACVIGTYVVNNLFDGTVKIGDTIRIGGQIYTIVGIQAEQADSSENSTDDVIYIPYSNAARLSGSANISNFTFACADTDTVTTAETLLDNFLYSNMMNEELYTVTSMTELLDQINSITSILSSVLGGIAGISLLVAGIGIMNIMLVSVIERTKEIGIRKALGAKTHNIMGQFVVEAILISTLGGIIGMVLGTLLCTSLGNAFGVDASPSSGAIILAFSVSAITGILFGYMPAKRAAKLNPIDALRNE